MLWYNLESLSWGFGHYSSTQTIPSWRTNSKGKIEPGLGTSHSESEMKFSSMCCSSQHKQEKIPSCGALLGRVQRIRCIWIDLTIYGSTEVMAGSWFGSRQKPDSHSAACSFSASIGRGKKWTEKGTCGLK